jgi:hypothetical protein
MSFFSFFTQLDSIPGQTAPLELIDRHRRSFPSDGNLVEALAPFEERGDSHHILYHLFFVDPMSQPGSHILEIALLENAQRIMTRI